MTPLIVRATAWLGTHTADSREVAEEVLSGNLRRLRWLLPVFMVLNIVCVVVFWWDGGNMAPQQRAWKSAVGWTHFGMAACMLAWWLVVYWASRQSAAGRTGRWLEFAVPMSLLLFTVALTVIDQWVTPNISPFLLGCAFVSLLLLTRPAVTLVLFLAGYAFFYAGLGLTQHDPIQLLANRVSGFFAAVLGLVLGWMLWQKNTGYMLLQGELKSRNLALLQQQEELVWLAKRDALTGLYNRGEFLRLAEAELLRAQRHRTDTSAIMMDMDFFKNINDVYGHPAGDSALKHAATCLLAGVRATDVVARVGGEEFMVLLPQTSADSALALAQKLLRGLQQSPAPITRDLELAVTASFGVGTLPAGQSGTVALLYAASDHALYEAKRRGRNRVERTVPDASLTASDFQRMRRR